MRALPVEQFVVAFFIAAPVAAALLLLSSTAASANDAAMGRDRVPFLRLAEAMPSRLGPMVVSPNHALFVQVRLARIIV